MSPCYLLFDNIFIFYGLVALGDAVMEAMKGKDTITVLGNSGIVTE